MILKDIKTWSRFEKHFVPEPNTGCWLWFGTLDKDGYGDGFSIYHKKIRPHRFAYVYHRGFIPEGYQIDHLCRVRNCVNPDHFEIVTLKENVLRGIGITAKNAKKTHCPKSHPLSGDNLYKYFKDGKSLQRHCRECKRIEKRRRRTKAAQARKIS